MKYVVASARPLLHLTMLDRSSRTSSLPLLLSSTLLALILLFIRSATPLHAQSAVIRYVDSDAVGATHDGLTWTTAFTNVQDALAITSTVLPTSSLEIWVAEGTYYPDQGTMQVNNNISSTIQLVSDVALYGGFAGTETLREQRNWTTHRTLLSGDIDGDGTANNNALHVVTAIGVTTKAVLDGFVITAGNASGTTCPQACGGGMYSNGSLATLTNLLFLSNTARYGGAMYNGNFSRPTTNTIIFDSNIATADGGAMYDDGVNLTATNVLFYDNRAVRGGAVFHTSSSSIGSKFRNVIFWGNSASGGDANLHNDENASGTSGSDLSYGILQGNCPTKSTCDNWFNADPRFVDADGADNIPGTLDDNLQFQATSPAIDVGSDGYLTPKITTDFNGLTRSIDGNGDLTVTVDLGPYEFPGYDLKVGLSVTPTAVVPGSQVTYTFRITNAGVLPATNIVLTATRPVQVTTNGVSSSGVVITQTNASPLVWQLSNIASGSSGVITLTAVVTGASWITMPVSVVGDTGDIVPSNNSSVVGVYLIGTRYVAPTAPGPLHDGTSWSKAFTTVQSALVSSFSGDEIWVAAGTYYPDEGTSQTNNATSSSFQLKNGVSVYGGFAGNESARAQRDWQSRITELSGDLEQNDTISATTGTTVISGTNAYHVVTANGVNSSAVLDGFVLRNGNAVGSPKSPCIDKCGGGIYVTSASPTLRNLTIFGNKSGEDGAGIFTLSSQPTLNNISILLNQATRNGGGLYNLNNSTPLLTSVIVSGNQATSDGGGIYNNNGSNAVLSNVLVEANIAGSEGGGIYNYTSNPVLTNVVVQRNKATTNGGGIENNYGSNPQISNIQILNNQADLGGGMYNDRTSLPSVSDVAFYNNRATSGGAIYNKSSSSALLTNTTIISNVAQFGAGIFNVGSSPNLWNVLFSANLATDSGGAFYNSSSSAPILNNVTIANNRAITTAGAIYDVSSNPSIRNSLIWGNTPSQQIFNKTGSNPVITYTLVQAACATGQLCNGVLQADPQFRDANGADNILYTADDDLHPVLGSPVIDVGSNALVTSTLTLDLDHKPRLTDGDGNNVATIDLGAYEFQRYDLGIAIAVTPLQPLPHDTITYTIWYSNAGPNRAENVLISDSLPISVALTGISSSGALITQTGTSPLRWQVSDLDAGSSGMITVTGTLTEQAWIINNAAIAANFEDAYTANNSTSVSFYLTGIRYVKPTAAGPMHDGLTWATAFVDLQTALAAAQPQDEVWVAAGVYRPDEGGAQVNNDVNATFNLLNQVFIYGGFAGNETLRSQRDWQQNVTVLSGDIDKNDTTDSNGVVVSTADLHGSNARHVVSGLNLNSSARLDGFTITAGNANTSGGAMLNDNSSPTLANLIFSANRAIGEGGAMANLNGSEPTLSDSLFYSNVALNGGGMSNSGGSGPALQNVTFDSNQAAGGKGGGMYNYASFPTLVNGTFVANLASNGGGMYNEYLSTPSLTNVTFAANQANKGSALYNLSNSGPTLTQVTIKANVASGSGTLYNDTSSPSIRNSIIWGNQANSGATIVGGTSTIASTLVEGACAANQTCFGTVQADPQFGALTNYGNNMLAYPLLSASSAVDAGNDTYCPATDQRGGARPQGGHCDLGAYEAAQTDLQLTTSAAPNPVSSNSTLQYSLLVTNNGPTDSTGVVVTVTLPSTLNYVSDTCGVGGVNGAVFTWSIGNLNLGSSRSCALTVSPNNSVGTSVSTSAAAWSDLYDPDISNQQVVVNTTVTLQPTATATQTPIPPTATNTPVPTATATQTPIAPTATATQTPVVSPSPTQTTGAVPTATSTATSNGSATATVPASPTPTATNGTGPTPTATATNTGAQQPTTTATLLPPSATPIPGSTATPTPSPVATPSSTDLDGDGLPNSVECSPTCVDTDGDGLTNDRDIDSDGDGIIDSIEVFAVLGADSQLALLDSDSDGAPDYLDTDSDNDTLPDSLEAYDANFDGKPDIVPMNKDSNGNGLDDAYELGADGYPRELTAFPDFDGDGVNWRDPDDDNDGIPTSTELGANPGVPVDADGDGHPDYLQSAKLIYLPLLAR